MTNGTSVVMDDSSLLGPDAAEFKDRIMRAFSISEEVYVGVTRALASVCDTYNSTEDPPPLLELVAVVHVDAEGGPQALLLDTDSLRELSHELWDSVQSRLARTKEMLQQMNSGCGLRVVLLAASLVCTCGLDIKRIIHVSSPTDKAALS